MFVYLTVLFILGLFAIMNCKIFAYSYSRDLTLGFCGLVILCVLNILRAYSVGADTRMYAIDWALPEIKNSSFIEIIQKNRWEIGFAALCKICIHFKDPSRTLLVLAGLLIYSMLGLAIYRLTKNFCLVILLFFLSGQFYGSMNTMRQTIAAAIVMVGVSFLTRDENYEFFLLIFMAALFHKSALLMLLLYPAKLILMRKSRQIIVTAYTCMLLAFLVLPSSIIIPVLGYTGYSNYIDNAAYGSSGHIAPILYLLCFCSWIVSFSLRKKKRSLLSSFDLCYFSFLAIGALICVCAFKIAIFIRLADYCFTGVLILGSRYQFAEISRSSKIQDILLFYLPFVFLFAFSTFVVPTWTNVFPYRCLS